MTDTAVDPMLHHAPPHPLVQRTWVDFPRWLSQKAPFLGGLVSDGHTLTALGPVVLLLEPALFLFGLWVGWKHPGEFITLAEGPNIILFVLAVGTVSSRMGLSFFIGFILGDFFLFNTIWSTVYPGYGPTEPHLHYFAYYRVPFLIHYLVIGALLLGVPAMARALVQSIALYIPPIRHVDTVLAAAACAMVAYILVTLWAGTAPIAILPLQAFGQLGKGVTPDFISAPSVYVDDFARGAALFMLGRFALFAVLPLLPPMRRRVEAVEERLFAPLPPRRPAGTRQKIILSALGALIGVAYLTGMLRSWTSAFAIYAALLFALLSRYRVVPFPPKTWRGFMERIPALPRFFAGLALVAGIGQASVAGFDRETSLDALAISAIAAAFILLLLLPGDEESDLEKPGPGASPEEVEA